MCGIIGYIGHEEVIDILIEGLQRLEYRGYDSAGVAVYHPETGLTIQREVGKLGNLIKKVAVHPLPGHIGIGHTRWATHGRPTEFNAHPHTDSQKRLVVVHNGIIENYLDLKQFLSEKGHQFDSETDTEVIAHLVEYHYRGDLKLAVQKTIAQLEGSYAICVMHIDQPDYLMAAKKNSPLLLGKGRDANFIASDVPAILRHTRDIIYLEDEQMALVAADRIEIYDLQGKSLPYEVHTIDWNIVAAEKMGYDHFMLKEIHEQPTAFGQTLAGRLSESHQCLYLDELNLNQDQLRGIRRIYLVACGTAYYAGLVGKYLLESLARIPVEVDLASEFRYRDPILDDDTLVVAISQSGETADTLAAIRMAKEMGARTLGVVNVKGSAITRSVDGTLYIHAGPEISVASTKAFIAMLAAMQLLALQFAHARGRMETAALVAYMRELRKLPRIMEETLKMVEPQVQETATRLLRYHHCLYLGRGINFPIALEGALKLKEVSYIHAEGYAAGELKHGPIALIDPLMPVIALVTAGSSYDKVISNLKEVRAREGQVIAIATEGDERIREVTDDVIYVPLVSELLSPVINVLPLQLLAYYVALRRGYDVDQPRNLAKSVTVE
ncbi:glutamine--fructose-6-phosphate transaminase (isomerizing) [bacterium (Candidatus Blackallbacteria) CG17_big_fil_post_rev_8_21_14_2_50_48_46]|uniref:Glutamine--fructose-6-phosphate aminotransferase [isomerizing] n=1 Tax=bacterium (Candidatus Blackallbacteria) CG17_big_fil_post_rev_8_21_14_2_50_48_46 TaxID=2014261 RepID=A0A2M7G6R2_9BACT|nr:MAG: glutamine--fructose-6-phosphate transaminase (isomerizing) [bacterium (Candidatus Blackallbacteria) CG18_big_fil_WC_8_21_14_2_50_49_26]PIW17730.1 MAG: glutamine--fructose-6-phosphate transaminase (isomerizing) [bacterium (Candidatus Blackallbacteria) CG17_big_fil_post_rev_8_21_14_2_50_48_46]PIW47758.1 MAG: glutamine--fructose-6-phosphate transaminase (isomerizing) [bacterium (Candidatus Blackallbacteria) CG13_big_fil_rev_8_21_14_2_50_49_14]